MAATTGVQAGFEANQTQLSYGVEAAYGVAPASTFQAIRYNSENLKGAKTRTRPNEIRGDRQMSGAITTQETAGGTISAALSYGTFDDLISSLLGSDWQAPTTVQGAAGDVALNAVGAQLTSTTSGKFSAVKPGSWIKLSGFTNAANNTFLRVVAKPDNQTLTVAGGVGLVTETPAGTAAKVTFSNIANGTQAKTLFLQQRFSSSGFLRYPGSYVTRMQLAAQIGQFLSGSFDILASQELKGSSDASTGGILPAPVGAVHNPVAGIKGIYFLEALFGTSVDQCSFDLTNDGAAQQFALGSSLGIGQLLGTFMSSASFRAYFRDFAQYDAAKSETAGAFAMHTADAAGNRYVLTIPNATLVNPQVDAGGVGQAVMATFTVEANPDPVSGATLLIDRFAATA